MDYEKLPCLNGEAFLFVSTTQKDCFESLNPVEANGARFVPVVAPRFLRVYKVRLSQFAFVSGSWIPHSRKKRKPILL